MKKKEFGVVSLFGESVREWVFIEKRKEKRRRKARELSVFACSSKENIKLNGNELKNGFGLSKLQSFFLSPGTHGC